VGTAAVPNLCHSHSSLLDKAPQGIAAGTLQGNAAWLPMRAINTTDFDQQPAKHHILHAVTEESQGITVWFPKSGENSSNDLSDRPTMCSKIHKYM
jgi:uncharacterized membrane protein